MNPEDLRTLLAAIVPILGASILALSWKMNRNLGEVQGWASEWKLDFAERDKRAKEHSDIFKVHGLELVRIDAGVRSLRSSHEDLSRSLMRVEGKLDGMAEMMLGKAYPGWGGHGRSREVRP